jgi:hypothetical protein
LLAPIYHCLEYFDYIRVSFHSLINL